MYQALRLSCARPTAALFAARALSCTRTTQCCAQLVSRELQARSLLTLAVPKFPGQALAAGTRHLSVVSSGSSSHGSVAPKAFALASQRRGFFSSSVPGKVPGRAFCSSTGGNLDFKLPPILEESLRGVGQVLFLNSPVCGGLILAALAVGDPWLASLATIGTLSATLAARGLKFDADWIKNGLAGYNGCLVGCAFAVFLGQPAWAPAVALGTVAGAAVSAVVANKLGPLMPRGVPQWTLPFNFTTLSVLGYFRPLADAPEMPARFLSELTTSEWLLSPLVGISQIFVVNNPLSGALILAAIGYYSRGCAGATLLGSSLGVVTAAAIGVNGSEIVMGLWGFNPALTSLAVSVFFVPTMNSLALSAGGAVSTAVMFGGMKTVMASTAAVPALTMPFCVVASGCYLARGLPGLVHAASPHSPELNKPPAVPP
eukprot:gnl/TRDRNA2_/TRDRNA2_192632_c0_seq1.p1 gnl/TRDRNA2_/TRDRNA2_192632_c0~~gnl/TRDRNA2_/TRDRNA2_192632_c0_seq1.p1  ORF type:complete len:430 (-),score=52.80 gnl/TRDRNA2_/TRDRNA2_192632_c0_seq1:384-1673(-)